VPGAAARGARLRLVGEANPGHHDIEKRDGCGGLLPEALAVCGRGLPPGPPHRAGTREALRVVDQVAEDGQQRLGEGLLPLRRARRHLGRCSCDAHLRQQECKVRALADHIHFAQDLHGPIIPAVLLIKNALLISGSSTTTQ
jgi:hypothetical protein